MEMFFLGRQNCLNKHQGDLLRGQVILGRPDKVKK